MERNILLTLQYDGSNYAGWQRQPASHGATVQQEVETALSQVFREQIVVAGAGRTDSGVHAWGQRCSFRAHSSVPLEKLPDILNRRLPGDIRVSRAEQVADSFHARFTAHRKRYRYVLAQSGQANAFNHRYAWFLDGGLDLAAMQEGAAHLLGTHDFWHYTVSGVSASDFVRTISSLDVYAPEPQDCFFPWQELPSPILVEVEADGFLYKMVRIIVGRLVAVGQGRIPARAMADYLDGSFDLNIPPAPPQGLQLLWVRYAEAEAE
ncbi:MAG: tRNA pseudouridine(38-40) synthase TruA [Firmicutes bacterium]|nr:tRNA pseudouridine(38-40) synthase TruA [Bacillota bacterium]